VSKESSYERKSPGVSAFNEIEFWNQISFRNKDGNKLPELPLNISTTSESTGEVETVEFLDNNTGERLTSVETNRESGRVLQTIVLDRKSGICKMDIFNHGHYTNYYFSEDNSETFTLIDRQTFTYLLKNNMSLSDVRARVEVQNSQNIFSDKDLWMSLSRGIIPDEYIGQITANEGGEWEYWFDFTDLATRDVMHVELYDRGGTTQYVKTKIGFFITNGNYTDKGKLIGEYYFCLDPIEYYEPNKIQVSEAQFFEALKNQQPPLT